MADSRIVFQLDAVLLGNAIMLAQRGKKFCLFDRINAEVGFHIQVNIKHIFRVTRLFAYHFHDFFGYAGFVQRYRRSGRGRRGLHCRSRLRNRSRSRNRCWRGCLYGRRFARISEHKFNAMADCRIVFQLDAVLLGNAIMFAQGSKKFCLFDRINTEVGFHIQVNIKHIFRITSLFAYHFHDFFRYAGFVQRYRRSGRGRRGLHCRSRLRNRSRSLGFVGVNRVHFIHKSLRAFHYQGRFHTVAIIIFNTQGVLHNFQHRGFLAGNGFQPRCVFGFISDTGFPFLPHFFK